MKVILLAISLTAALTAQELPPPPATPAPPTAALEGAITEAAGHPVPGRVLTLTSNEGTRTTRTGADGHYRFEGLAAGAATLASGTTEGYFPQRKRVDLAAGQPLRADLRLHKAPILSGRVVDADKHPVEGVFVRARKEGYLFGRPATVAMTGGLTNALGEFRFVVAGSGAFVIDVETKHRKLQVLPEDADATKQEPVVMDTRTYYPGSPTPDGALPVMLRPDESIEGLEIVLLRGRTVCLAAKAVLPSGRRSAGVGLSIAEAYNDSQSLVASGSVPPGTQVQACGIPSGLYEVSATTLSGERLYTSELVAVTDRFVRAPDLYPQPQADLSGHIVVHRSDTQKPDVPLQSLLIWLEPEEGLPAPQVRAAVADSGDFSLKSVALRNYTLNVQNLPPHLYVQSARLAGHDVYEKPLFPEQGDVALTLADDGPVISGGVVDADGQPVPDTVAVLALWPMPSAVPPNRFLAVRTGPRGEFTFTGVPPGEYRLFAFSGVDLSDIAPKLVSAYATQGEDLDLTPGLDKRVQPVVIETAKR